MNKREFLGNSLRLAAGTSVGMATLQPAWAQSELYTVIDPPVDTKDRTTVEVLEYFWFGCPHCFAFEPAINKWAADKPDYVSFVREAPPLNAAWEPHSRAFYAAELMGVTDTFFDPMFNAIHEERRSLNNNKSIASFAGELGIDAELFAKTMDSFGVENRLRSSIQMAQASGISGVPSVVINGKYLTGASQAGSHEGIISVINEMSAKEEKLLKQG